MTDESPPEGGEASGGYIKTTTHNYISRQAKIEGPKQVEVKGRSIVQHDVTIRGDLAIVRIGRYCEVEESTVLEPPELPKGGSTTTDSSSKRIPMVIGSHTHIGKNCTIHAAAIGSMVWIGDNVQLGSRCIVKDNCIIESNVRLGKDTVVAPFTRVEANNSTTSTTTMTTTTMKELPPAIAVQLQELSLDRFQEFKEYEKELQYQQSKAAAQLN